MADKLQEGLDRIDAVLLDWESTKSEHNLTDDMIVYGRKVWDEKIKEHKGEN